jgi:hypothetical protein
MAANTLYLANVVIGVLVVSKALPFVALLWLSATLAPALPAEGSPSAAAKGGRAASVQRWLPFHNDRYGFSVDIPGDFTASPPPENGDGRTFTSKDGRATILAYGHLFVDVEGLNQDEREQEEFAAKDGLKVTYRQVSARATTFSGLQGDTIVYQHAVATCKSSASAIIHAEYPRAEKARFDPLVAHMAQTLRGSNRCWSQG